MGWEVLTPRELFSPEAHTREAPMVWMTLCGVLSMSRVSTHSTSQPSGVFSLVLHFAVFHYDDRQAGSRGLILEEKIGLGVGGPTLDNHPTVKLDSSPPPARLSLSMSAQYSASFDRMLFRSLK